MNTNAKAGRASPREQLVKALADPHHRFTRTEAALLMATAFRWGYEQRSDEEVAGLIPVDFSAIEVIRDLERKAVREENDSAVREQAGRGDG